MSEVERMPERPFVPPALCALLAALVAASVGLSWGEEILSFPSVLQVLLCVSMMGTVALLLSVLAVKRRESFALGVVCIVVAGLMLVTSIWGVCVRDSLEVRMSSTPVSRCAIEVVGDPSEGVSGSFTSARLELPDGGTADVWLSSDEAFERGTRLVCVGRFEHLGDDDWGRSSRLRGMVGTVSVSHVLERAEAGGAFGTILALRRHLLSQVGPSSCEERALLAGCVLGWRVDLKDSGLEDVFSADGLSHLVAVSGSHLALLASFVAAALSGTRLGPSVRSVMVIVLCSLYVVLTGMATSAVRSLAMLGAAEVARLAGRRAHPLSAVSLVALAMLLLRPTLVGDLGFLLSVSSVVSLCIFSGYVDALLCVLVRPPGQGGLHLGPGRPLLRRCARTIRSVARSIRSQAASSLVAHFTSAPLVMTTFSSLSLVGPLANLLVGPLFSLCMLVGLGAVLLSGAGLVGAALLATSDCVMGLFIMVARWLSQVPFACIPVEVGAWVVVAGVAAEALVLVLWPCPSRGGACEVLVCCLVAAALMVFVPWWGAPARIVILDIGQGDAILVQQGPHAVLVDTGPGDAIASALAREHVLALDAIVLTHLHDDHIGGVDDLVGVVSVRDVFVADGVDTSMGDDLRAAIRRLTNSDSKTLEMGDSLQVGGFAMEVVWPDRAVDGSENADSLCLSVSFDDGERTLDAYLTGDAERDETRQVLASGEVGDVDLLKVGHHGSAVSIDQDEAATLDPEVSVASAGENNRYGHPKDECLAILEGAGSRFFCTKDDGDVCVMPGASGPVVETSGRGGGLAYDG
ncbi:MAG: DNA internalization-related competence protein ComEC/Rec2 [Atopobiaceae bacterium]|nr:DNA internalization-related competence protein ComEC/Rec2 [Atopobiaceae bacterium]